MTTLDARTQREQQSTVAERVIEGTVRMGAGVLLLWLVLGVIAPALTGR
ncbi:MAG: hypothetical protein ACOH1T_03780 [Microbacteriaceae bacterium]